ncbi:MAG: NYN domain-containing protein, partial [Fimbriimonadales bacterium]|nr:NYN domain-containing protein [Fimbriimonadales bacterium]
MIPTSSRQSYSAIFADLENIYFYLKNNNAPNPELLTTELIRRTRDHIVSQYQEPCILMIGYADFDRMDLSLGDFYLMGMEPRTVVNTEHKNSADMRLCIDALETLYTRPEIQTFVLMAGDRDYIPLVQHLQRQART